MSHKFEEDSQWRSSPFDEGPALNSSDIIQHLDGYEHHYLTPTCAQPPPVSPFQLSPFKRRLEIEDVHNTMIHCLTRLEELHATRYPLPEKFSIALQQYFCPHPPSRPCNPQYFSSPPVKSHKPSWPQLSTPRKSQRVPDKPRVLVPDTPEWSETPCSMRSIPFDNAASISPVILAPNTSSPATIIPVPAFRKCVRFRPY
ncbi:uncharacterized protein ARMOST_17415 [Armillaria ostoyae]|uniref:Uncharacterized protein n=1 Tax=Armillaria ostoyae TaxID=47428 RepID=A0A284RYW6_ARMOS|nr:uncharacterized protein ARMOST_17413 [Armillaria ostoyae]SJL13963.1 uncharacterized protein ARMOST_17415 [Armillaria ostoyae]